MSKPVFLLSAAVLVAMSFSLTVFALDRPFAHWDIIAYVASALKSLGLSGEELRAQTYEVIRNAYDPATFAVMTGGPGDTGHGAYRYTIYTDPAALEQQLPFYRIRVAYIFLLNAIAPLAGGLVGAAQAISAVCAGLITLVTGVLLMRGFRPLPAIAAFIGLPLIIAGAGVIFVGRLETPDALAALIALLALALVHSHRLVAVSLAVVLVLVRTDGALLAGLFLVLLLAERETRIRYYVPLCGAFVLYFLVNHLYENYSHLVLFNFTLLNAGPDPYPATMKIETDIGIYVKFYIFAVMKFAPTLLFLALVLLVAAADIRSEGGPSPFTARALIAVAFIGGHFLLFPLGDARHYVFAMVFASVYAAQTLFRQGFGDTRAARVR